MRIALLLFSSLWMFAGNAVIEQALKSPGRLESDLERDKTSKPGEILAFFGIEPGMVVADILAGGGYYTELLSAVVGEKGHVLSQNNKAYLPFVQKELDQRKMGERLKNVTVVTRETDALELGENQYDAVFFILGFHDIYYKDEGWSIDAEDFMGQLHKALKPGGKLCIVDHAAAAGTGSASAQELHRIEPSFAKKAIEGFGFKFVKSSDVLKSASDDGSVSVFDASIRRKTSRFVYLFEKN
ncbi:MAG: class I SAM-dependent methyltransferase [Acidobacteria bacterium]|nr:class I SAM-dependent methyltransferase [Acidobacteriota bacterium]